MCIAHYKQKVSVNQTNASLTPVGNAEGVRSDCRRLDGRLFHNRGPATGNARSPRRV